MARSGMQPSCMHQCSACTSPQRSNAMQCMHARPLFIMSRGCRAYIAQPIIRPAKADLPSLPGPHATGHAGMPWDQVVGLQYIKQQLLGLCPCKAAAGGSAAPARESHTLQQQQQPRLMRAPTRNAPAGAGTPTRSTRPQVGASSTPTGTGRAGQGGARAPQAAALPAAAAASPPSGAGSRAVLLYGPAGMGKALVVRSLVAQQQEGASLIVVPSGLATCPRNGMHADRLVRAVFRVRRRRPEAPPHTLLPAAAQAGAIACSHWCCLRGHVLGRGCQTAEAMHTFAFLPCNGKGSCIR